MEPNNNPLRQYFRRPLVYVKLPSGGKFYTMETVDMPENGELPVYPMTAIDDITSKTPDALFNGQAVVDIIKSCVPNIKNPWKLNSIDLDAVLIAIKSASNSGTMEIVSGCPKCGNDNEYNINLAGMLSTLDSPNYDEPLILGDLQIFFRPLVYKEINEVSMIQLEMQKVFGNLNAIENEEERTKKSSEALKTITSVTVDTIVKTIKGVKLPDDSTVNDSKFIAEFLRGCDKHTFDTIRDFSSELKQKSSIKPMKIRCLHCQHEYEQAINMNITDFFE